MSVNKITTAPQPITEVNKINEIVDVVNSLSSTKADDSDVVHKTGAEDIAGVKTFTSTLYNKKNDPAIVLQHTGVTKGTTPSETEAWVVANCDSVGATVANRLMAIGNVLSALNNNDCFIRAYKPASGSTAASSLGIVYPASGNPYAYCDASDVAGSILTTAEIGKGSSSAYFRLGNGLLIQRGYEATSGGETTVTFPKAFSGNNSYTIVKCYNSSGTTNLKAREGGFYSQTTTNAKTYCTAGETTRFYWLAIGY